MEIILASGSPRRKELLQYVFSDFKVIPSSAEEIYPENWETEKIPEFLAAAKAGDIAKNYPDALVVGCDTVVLAEGRILGKPKDKTDAEKMLRQLSGKKHRVITGCCALRKGKSIVFSQQTEVEFYPLTQEEITAYIQTGEPFDKAGGYGIQGHGALLVRAISGDYFNVVGLPVARLKRELQPLLS